MTAILGEMDLDDAAKKAAGNWRSFDSFCWHRASELDDAGKWTIVYSYHRDSGLLDQSNAAAITEAMNHFTDHDEPDVIAEHHHHWAVGWVDGFAIRVFGAGGDITDAFRAYHEIVERLADYPILDEEDYSCREYESTLRNIGDAAWGLKRRFELPEDWESLVFSWFRDHNQHAVENRDDQGGYPTEDELELAFAALGFTRTE